MTCNANALQCSRGDNHGENNDTQSSCQPTVKQQAEDVLKQLGIPMATAIDMYLRQITMTGGIPFPLSLPKVPAALNADTMTDDQLHAALQVGINEIQNDDTVDAVSAFAQFREQHR